MSSFKSTTDDQRTDDQNSSEAATAMLESNLQQKMASLTPQQRAKLQALLVKKNAIDNSSIENISEQNSDFGPLSLQQRWLWLMSQLNANSSAYHIPGAFLLNGVLDEALFSDALHHVAEQHAILRTCFNVDSAGEPFQQVMPQSNVEFCCVTPELGHEGASPAALDRLARDIINLPFEMTKGPLWRAHLLRLDTTHYFLVLSFHHIIFDGWSLGLFVRELFSTYQQLKNNSQPTQSRPLQYSDYVVWQSKNFTVAQREREVDFWQRSLAEPLPTLELPTDRHRPAEQTFSGSLLTHQLPKNLLERVKQLAQQENSTPYAVFLAAYQALIHRYTAAEEVIVGTPVSGRAMQDTQSLIGMFVNTLPIRTYLKSTDSFRVLVRQVRDVSLEAFAHATLPFNEIVEAVRPERSAAHHPLFQTLFTYQNAIADIETDGVQISYRDVDLGTAKFDLSLDVFEGHEGIVCLFEFNTDLFNRDRIARLGSHFEMLLNAALHAPDSAIGELNLLTETESQFVCASVLAPVQPLPVNDFVALFEQQAQAFAQHNAVIMQGATLSYAQLNQQANQLAHYLSACGAVAGKPIGLCFERTPSLIISILAVLKLGAPFVALEPSYPIQRLAHVASDAQIQMIISATEHSQHLAQLAAPLISWETAQAACQALSGSNLGVAIAAEDCAYIVYTSGTTGKPKGVQVTQGNMVNAYLGWQEVYHLDKLHAHLQMASFPFDVFCGDLIRTLGSGKAMVICPQDLFADPKGLCRLIDEHQVDFAEFVPAVFRVLADYLESTGQRLNTLQVLVVASDVWYVSEYRHYRSLLAKNTRLVNSYGMAEATIDSTWFEAEIDAMGTILPGYQAGQLVPIGQPFPNVEVMVLDAQLQPVPLGVTGEICVGGLGLSRGYLNRPELNSEKFVVHPFAQGKSQYLYRSGDLGRLWPDGNLELLGRRDTQTKIRGMRIELGEIESILRKHVSDVAVVVRDSSASDKSIVAYVVNDGESAPTAEELNVALSAYLPSYMLPSHYVSLSALPLSANGKVDRQRLPAPSDLSTNLLNSFVSPRTLTEEMLATIWCQVFKLNRVGVHDDFFALGGHSLLAFQLVAQIRETFQVDLPLRVLFVNPTISGLAETISDLQGRRSEYDATINALPELTPDPDNAHLPFPMTEVQQAYWLGRNDVFEFGNVSTHSYDELETHEIDVARFQRAWNKVVARHPMLRAEILPDGTQRILQQVPEYRIHEYDLRDCSEESRQQCVDNVRQEMSHQVLNVHCWPVFDVRITRLSDRCSRIHISSDALIFDVWSFVIIIEDLTKYYLDEEAVCPPLMINFRDYVLAEAEIHNTDRYLKAVEYWRGRLPSLAPAPELPMAMDPSLLKKPHFTRLHAKLEPQKWNQLKLKAIRAGMTATGLMLAAYAEVLAAYSRSPAFSLNLTFLNRHPLHPQVNEIVGEFTSLTMLGVDQRQGSCFLERARLIQGDLWNDLEHNDVSGVKILRELTRTQGGATRAKMPVVFTSALVVPIPKRQSAFPLNPIYRDGVTQTSQVWLDCGVWEDDHVLLCNWDVVLELYPEGLIEEMFESYWTLVQRLAESDEAWHTTDLIVTPAQPAVIDNLEPLPVTTETLSGLFLASLQRDPQALALIQGEQALSYQDLSEYAAWVATEVTACSQRGDAVAVVMDKSWQQVAAVLGIVACGMAYLPVEPSLPDERIMAILQDGNASSLLTTAAHVQRLASLADLPVIQLDEQSRVAGRALNEFSTANPDDVAYIIFTSGSTGRPKGVVIDHKGAVNTLLDLNDRYQFGPKDRTLAVSSLSFDLSVFDIFGTLAMGGCIVMPSHHRRLDPQHWAELIQQHHVTIWNSVPALYSLLLDYAEESQQQLAQLRRVLLSGDWIPTKLPTRGRACCPAAHFTSLGGATEASIWSILYDIDHVCADWKSIPYGKSMRNQSVEVLNSRLQPSPDWVTGDLYIGGIGLALGYQGDEAKTAAAFIKHPITGERLYRTGDLGRRLPDGNIEFLGRSDFQVKVQGHRIELGDIESTLMLHNDVHEAVVIVMGERYSEKRLVAFVVLKSQANDGSVVELRQWLFTQLPEYMIPQHISSIEQLPLTDNGKVDRQALPALFDGEIVQPLQTAHIPPRNEDELRIASIWQEIFGVTEIGVLDNFFSIGGDSMLAIKLLALLRHRVSDTYQLKDVFLHPTIEALSSRLVSDEVAE